MIYPGDNVIRPLNNWGQEIEPESVHDRIFFPICLMESTWDHDMEIEKKISVNFSLRFRHPLVPKPWGLGPRTSLVVTSKQDCRSTLIFRECLQFWTKLDWNYAWLPSTWYIFLVSICLIRKMCKSTFLFWRYQLTSPRSQALAVSNPNGREISRF